MVSNYILFILQDGEFDTRSMIVPTELFLKARQKEYNILKDYSVETSCCLNSSIFAVVDNLVLQPVICTDSGDVMKQKPFTKFYKQLLKYAEGSEDFYTDEIDTEWYDKTIIQLCDGKNHVENYTKCKNMPSKSAGKVKFTDSFLILEKRIIKTKIIQSNSNSDEDSDNFDIQSCQSDNTISTKDDDFEMCQSENCVVENNTSIEEYVDIDERTDLLSDEL